MPLAKTENVAADPSAMFWLVGGVETTAPFVTVSVKGWGVAEPPELVEVSVNEKGEPVVFGGVPLITPVVVSSEAHGGNDPVKPNAGAGEPDAVTVKVVPDTLTGKETLAALVIAGT